jgi:hypothetical protein
MSLAPDTETLAKPETLFRVPVGFSSPLWGLFAGAAMTGAAWWWMTQWTQAANLEAMFGATAKPRPELEADATAPATLAAEGVEAALESAFEIAAEAAPEPVLEALIEAPADLPPVGGESGPISPVLQALEPDLAEPRTIEAAAETFSEPRPASKPKKRPSDVQSADKPA